MVIPFAQGPLFTVQANVFKPTVRSVTAVFAVLTFVMVPPPAITVHVPIAGEIMLLPANVAELLGVHRFWSAPAFATGFALS